MATTHLTLLRTALTTLAIAAVAACSDGTGDDNGADSGLDGSDAAADADATDAPVGDAPSELDAAPDDVPDGGGDGTPDVDPDAGDVDGDAGPDAPTSWRTPVAFELAAPFAERHGDSLGRVSGWATHVRATARPAVGAIGGFGTGNGHAFALFGYGDPLNSMHTLAAPTYDKADGFFGDYALTLEIDGETAPFEEEWAARSLDSPAVLHRARSGALVLDTLDFAPWTAGPERFCMVRLVAVTNTGEAAAPTVAVSVTAWGNAAVEDGALVERRDARVLATRSHADATVSGRTMAIPVGPIEPGGVARTTVLHCAGPGATPPELPEGDPDAWFDATASAYREWESRLTDYSFPDPMLEDFVEGMKLTLITQTAETGATCPMSQYSRTWARDNIGPVLAWHAYGAFEEARATMDYIYGAVVLTGDFANSYPADLDLSTLPDPPDWGAMPTLPARVAAETPSYMVWIYGEHVAATGTWDFVEPRWGYLRRALLAQAFDDDLLLPFTDDETYRAAMNAVFGLALEYPHGARNTSANSSILWLGAARHYQRIARLVGRSEEAAEVADLAEQVEQAALEAYLLEDACIAALRERSNGRVSPPFEDVSLTPTWAGWIDGDDPRAAANLQCLIDRIQVEPGVLRSPVHPIYQGLPLLGGGEGVFTGMLPGYTLAALTAAGHPDALASFFAMARFTSTTGNFQEYLDAGTEAGLQIVYERSGAQGDYTSKYRPWEGGINVHAALDYLFGVRVDAVDGSVRLRPHLPPHWPEMAARGLRVGEGRFDLSVSRDAGVTTVELASRAETPLSVSLRWDAAAPPEIAIDGEPVAEPDLVRREHFGQHSAEATTTVAAGATVRFAMR